ncbi:conserved Plasmodium protein, unknown function [Plasmodium sp. gorilla clade G2]|uniref:conserved Plasmodium protein, unknown function n=1 Tax=Plasmodium sp. gorilla clade G2 TaxID=880535 RepID=UPI000D206A64|nr:conserved Plasmodium protein, unknown function [Plasmodium sp. gorilla clade G2]SOV15905.1 conserved Plasmodium protein, unknown function [Plasmodium sp. gorilla clade G2]
MNGEKLHGLFYRDCNLYVGEYILPDHIKNENIEDGKVKNEIKKKKAHINNSSNNNNNNNNNNNDNNNECSYSKDTNNEEKKNSYKQIYTSNDKEHNTEMNKNISFNQPKEENFNIIFDGEGKYIKKNEFFVGKFENNNYRKGIWVKYKNIHNLFYFMNIHEILLKGEDNNKNDTKSSLDNFQKLLYVPLKDINIYIGEFDRNMFNGFSLYLFYPLIYVGYFINNSMHGYGYIFYIQSTSQNNKNFNKLNHIFNPYKLYDFLFTTGVERENKTNTQIMVNKKNTVDNTNVVDKQKSLHKEEQISHNVDTQNINNNSKNEILFKIYKTLEEMINERNIDLKDKKNIKSNLVEEEKQRKTTCYNLINKIERDIYKTFKLNISKKKKINKIKKILYNNEEENIHNIFNHICYENLLFKGYFYNNHFSNNKKEQILYKELFIHTYKNMITEKINNIQTNIMNNDNYKCDELILENNILFVIEKNNTNKDKKKMNYTNKDNEDNKNNNVIANKENEKNDVHQNDYCNDSNIKIMTDNIEDQKEKLKFELFKNIIDINLLKYIFQLSSDHNNNIEYLIDIIIDKKKIIKYKNKINEFQTDINLLQTATLNLNGYYQLIILKLKCKGDHIFQFITNNCNIPNVYKIKIFLISSDKSSIIKYNIFHLNYILVYTRTLDKKTKVKLKKKKN